jgi:D-apionolactonase
MTMIPLRAGPLHMEFDVELAFLRYVRWGERELIRGVFAAVRDRNWDTIPGRVDDLTVDIGTDSFRIGWQVHARAGEVDFRWQGTLTGSADGSVVFDFQGTALRGFLKNRIGLCVLHPIEACSGHACRVKHVDGRVTHGRFPDSISPHQPFKEIRSIAQELSPHLTAEVLMEGDAFEMEDQRNWTDASYKTYSTPLELPFPVWIESGESVRQSVTVRLHGDLPESTAPHSDEVDAEVVAEPDLRRRRPEIGYGLSWSAEPLPVPTETLTQRLLSLRAAHVRCDLFLDAADWQQRLQQADAWGRAIEAPLQIALFLGDRATEQLQRLGDVLNELEPQVAGWLIFHVSEKSTSAKWVELARQALAAWDRNVPFAAGTNAYFAELNRGPRLQMSGVMPCYSINPQVHASDKLSLIETLEAQRDTVRTAETFSSQPVVISPITLLPRFNPNATDGSGDGAAPAAAAEPLADSRQSTLFAAAWTIGCLAELSNGERIHSLTLYELAGTRGVVDDEAKPYPVYYVFEAVADSQSVIATRVSQRLRVAALALYRGAGRYRLLLAGLQDEPVNVRISGFERVQGCKARWLGEDGFGGSVEVGFDGQHLLIRMPGESVAQIDWENVERKQ